MEDPPAERVQIELGEGAMEAANTEVLDGCRRLGEYNKL
jgi:hypothetical protein